MERRLWGHQPTNDTASYVICLISREPYPNYARLNEKSHKFRNDRLANHFGRHLDLRDARFRFRLRISVAHLGLLT
jgi:hypothetical protein